MDRHSLLNAEFEGAEGMETMKTLMENLRRDLVEVISKYMDFDEAALDVQMAEQDNMTMLEVNIPVSSVKRNAGN